ncbi:hypothetical protein D3C71_314790 [compost metagenome]
MNLIPEKTHFSDQEHAELRARVKGMIKPGVLSQADIGRQAEVSGPTLSQYLKGDYNGSNDNVAAALNKWVIAQAKAAELQDRIPQPPTYQPLETSQALTLKLAYARRAGRMISICGSPGVSKTSTAVQYRHETPRTWMTAIEPATRGVNTCLVAILEAMGDPEAKGTPQALARRIVQRAMEAECLIIIDEAQELSDQAVEQLRAINDRARANGGRVGIVLMGNQQAYARMSHDGSRPAFAQVSSRMAQRMWILKPEPADVEVLARAWAEANDEHLTPAALAYCQQIAARPGGLRNIEMSMEQALMAAWGVEEPLDVDHLRWAFNSFAGLDRAA